MIFKRKFKVFAVCIMITFFIFLANKVSQAQLILKEYIPPPTLDFANLNLQARVELYNVLKEVFDAEETKAKRKENDQNAFFKYLYILLKQLDPKQKDKNLQETDIVRKNALSEGQELSISFASGIAGAGIQFLTGMPAPFLGEGAKILGFKIGEYLVLRDISSATVHYSKIGKMEIIHLHSKNRILVNTVLEKPVRQQVFMLVPIELRPRKVRLGWAGMTCPPDAALKRIVPKLDKVKIVKSPIQKTTEPIITSSLKITPNKNTYQVKDILTAKFTIINKGNTPITFDVFTVGGRLNDECPQDKCPDFDWKMDVILKPNETYTYKGKLELENAGKYHFFTTYRKNSQWNTAIPKAAGVTNTVNIVVEETLETKQACRHGVEYPNTAHHKNAFDKAGFRGYSTWYAAERWLWDRDAIEMSDYVMFKGRARAWDKKEELPSIRDAHFWIEDAKKKGLYVDSKKPIKGSIVVFGATSKNWGGHVAYVESVDNKKDTFAITQMNAGSKLDPKTLKTDCFNKMTMDVLKVDVSVYMGMKILGFIYPSNYSTGSAYTMSGRYVPIGKDKLFLAKNWRDWELEFSEDGTFSWKRGLGGRWEIKADCIDFAFYPSIAADESEKQEFLKEEMVFVRSLTASIESNYLKKFTGLMPFVIGDINMFRKQQQTDLIKKTPRGNLWNKYFCPKLKGPEIVTLELKEDKTFWLSINSRGKWKWGLGGKEVEEIEGHKGKVIYAYYRFPVATLQWRFVIKNDYTMVGREGYRNITFVRSP